MNGREHHLADMRRAADKSAVCARFFRKALLTCSFCLALAAVRSYGAITGQAESWDGYSVEGWHREDTLNQNELTLVNPGDYLSIVFPSLSMSKPQVDLIYADEESSSGGFTGDYEAANIVGISFRIYCANVLPAQPRLYFCGAETGNMWYYPLYGLKAGEWVTCFVPLSYGDGWRLSIGPSKEKFLNDIRSVAWIGVRLQRNGSTDEQIYGLDDFVLLTSDEVQYTTDGLPCWWVEKYFDTTLTVFSSDETIEAIPDVVYASLDSDGDGMDNYAEYLAGTDPGSIDSVLQVDMDKPEKKDVTVPQGAVIRWKSVGNRYYGVWRTSDLMEGFMLIESNIPGTPPVNMYEDFTGTNGGPYFYRIKAER